MVLNSLEVEILGHLSDGVPASLTNPLPEESAAMSRLLDRGLVERQYLHPDNNVHHRVSVYRITDAGLMALHDHHDGEYQDPDQAASEAQRDDVRGGKLKPVLQWVLGVLGATLAALLAAWIARGLGW